MLRVCEIVLVLMIFLIFYTYLGYPVLLLLLAKNIKDDKKKGESAEVENKCVSLIVAAYNEEKIIEEKIKNISEIDYPKEKLFVFIASDGSNDRTNEIVKGFESENLKLIEYPRIGKVNVLNRTVPLTLCEIIVFSDANTLYNSQAIKKLTDHFSDPNVGCVCGRLKLINPHNVQSGEGVGFYWRYETWIKKMESCFGCVVGANGAIYAIRKKLFEEMPANIINDDFHISMNIMKKGYKVIYESEAVGTEEVAPDFKSEFSRDVRDGAGHYREIRYHSGLVNPMKGITSFSYVSHRLIRWMVPFFLPLIFLTNIALLNNPIYIAIFIAQLCIYSVAVLTFILQQYDIETRFFKIPLFFLTANLALMIGFWKNIFRTQGVTWNSTGR